MEGFFRVKPAWLHVRALSMTLLFSAVLLPVLAAAGPAAASKGPSILVRTADGWSEGVYENDDIEISFSLVQMSTYIKVVNKTDKVIKWNWPEMSFLLPDGNLRTMNLMYLHQEPLETKLLTPEKAKSEENEDDGTSIMFDLRGGYKLQQTYADKLMPRSIELLIPSGGAAFCQLGFNGFEYVRDTAEEGGFKKVKVAPVEFYLVASGYDKDSAFEWTVSYDYAGINRSSQIILKLIR